MVSTDFYQILCDAVKAIKPESMNVLTLLGNCADIYDLEVHDLGLDSVEMFEFIGYFEDFYAIQITNIQVFEIKNIGGLYQLINQQLGEV